VTDVSAPAPDRDARAWRAIVALFLVTLIWGGTFVWMKQGLDAARANLGPGHSAAGIAIFLALRFGLAAVLLALFVPRSRALGAAEWKGGLAIGGALYAGFLLQMSGLESVSPAVSAFLTSLYVLFTALCMSALERRTPSWSLFIGAALATVGAALIRGRPELTFNAGEWLTVAGAFVFALHILVTDRVTKRLDTLPVTLASLAWVALGSLLLLVYAQSGDSAIALADARALIASREFLVPLVLSSVLATMIAITLMNVYQRELDPVRAAILYALEPIWAALAGIAYGMDRFTSYLLFGGALLLAGNLIAEMRPRARS